jgi:hypothetical protein
MKQNENYQDPYNLFMPKLIIMDKIYLIKTHVQ